jgi:hypothetical protein
MLTANAWLTIRRVPIVHHLRSLTGWTVKRLYDHHRRACPGLDVHDPASPLVCIDQGGLRKSTNLGHYPGDETFDTDDDILAIGRDGFEKRVWGCWHVAVHQNLPSLVQDAEGHRVGVQVDATGKLVRLGVESPEVSSSS